MASMLTELERKQYHLQPPRPVPLPPCVCKLPNHAVAMMVARDRARLSRQRQHVWRGPNTGLWHASHVGVYARG